MRLVETPDAVRIEADEYSVEIPRDRPIARVSDRAGVAWLELALVAALDTAQGFDDTAEVRVGEAELDDAVWRLPVEAVSCRWRRKVVEIGGDDRTLRWSARVEGTGDLGDVRLLGGDYSGDSRLGTGPLLSAHAFATVFDPEPSDPARVCRSGREPAQVDIDGGGRGPASGHWFFTPPPFAFGFSQAELPRDAAPASVPPGPWLTVGIEAPIGDQTFTAFRYEPDERAFSLVLRYEGQTRVDGEFATPVVAFHFGAPDPYAGIARYAGELRRLGLAPESVLPSPVPAWWHEPIFCGWGAQFRIHRRLGVPAPYVASEDHYDQWLERLAGHGLVPGTIVIDDKWQAQYGTCEPDPERWPNLGEWIARRHESGQRVLLWWKAWDPEGLPVELCVTNSVGRAVSTDPSGPEYERQLRGAVRRMIGPSPSGLDADGLKIDFTGFAPSGPGLRRAGVAWGAALLHRLLAIVADEARKTKPEVLLVAHTPNPAFADVAGMIRLNDMVRFDEPDDPDAVIPQMLHRWRVARAACPELLIDTDDWSPPTLAIWREYQTLKPGLGVPALYFVDGLDLSGEEFEEADYALLRRIWAEARASRAGRQVAGESRPQIPDAAGEQGANR